MSAGSDVVIIGGGVIGLTTAYFLAREGARVTVLERAGVGQESSWAGAGIIPPSNLDAARTPFDKLRGLSCRLFPQLSEALREATGIDNGYRRCGGIEFMPHTEQALAEEWRGEGVVCRELSESQALELEPSLAPGLGAALHLPDLAQVRNPRHMQALLAACRALNVNVVENARVHDLDAEPGRLRSALSSHGTFAAPRFLLAGGAWTDELLAKLGWTLGIHPVRGQIALLKCDRPLFEHVLLCGAQYLVPRDDGRVLAGSTEEHVGFDKRTTSGATGALLALAHRLVPSLASVELEKTWAGLRPGSPDGLPYLGAVPGWHNVWVGAGHFRSGIQLSTGSALLLKEMMAEQDLTMDATAFRLERGR